MAIITKGSKSIIATTIATEGPKSTTIVNDLAKDLNPLTGGEGDRETEGDQETEDCKTERQGDRYT